MTYLEKRGIIVLLQLQKSIFNNFEMDSEKELLTPNLQRNKRRDESIQWLKKRCGDWKCPAVVFKDPGLGAGYESLKCSRNGCKC